MKIKIIKLKSLVAEKGYTFTDLASVSGLSRNTVSSICSGKKCSFMTAAKLSKAFGVTLETIAEE
jgi:plasmid maintenance system antidote protein VapI